MQNKNNEVREKTVSPITAGIMGATVAAVAGTAAVVLSNKERRRKIKKTLNQLGKKGKEWVTKAQATLNRAEKKLDEVAKSIPTENRARRKSVA